MTLIRKIIVFFKEIMAEVKEQKARELRRKKGMRFSQDEV